jgi:hypothetical protein
MRGRKKKNDAWEEEKVSKEFDKAPEQGDWPPMLVRQLGLLVAIVLGCAWLNCEIGGMPRLNSAMNMPSEFNYQKAKDHLKELSSFGPRIVGSFQNEWQTPAFLMRTLRNIPVAKQHGCQLEVERQTPSGEFVHAEFLGGFTSVYRNVTNVVARLSWAEAGKGEIPHDQSQPMNLPSILINAHYDSVPGSPGASDDGVGVAVMLELARVLASGPPLQHPVVFLFNGAEESNQQVRGVDIIQSVNA